MVYKCLTQQIGKMLQLRTQLPLQCIVVRTAIGAREQYKMKVQSLGTTGSIQRPVYREMYNV
jgi:hypothetical protein